MEKQLVHEKNQNFILTHERLGSASSQSGVTLLLMDSKEHHADHSHSQVGHSHVTLTQT